MGDLEDFVVCTIKCDLTKTTLKIYQPYLINKTTQVFKKYMKSLTTFNKPDTLNKGIVCNK